MGVEPTTFWSEVRRANPLRYAVDEYLLNMLIYIFTSFVTNRAIPEILGINMMPINQILGINKMLMSYDKLFL